MVDEQYEEAAVRARQRARLGDPEEAERIACSIPAVDHFQEWLHEKVWALTVIAEVYLAQGKTEDAGRVALEALDASRGLGHGGVWQEASSLEDIGAVLHSLGEREQAVELWKRAAILAKANQYLDDIFVEECGQVLRDLSLQFADLGDRDEAKTIAGMIGFPVLRERTLQEIESRGGGTC